MNENQIELLNALIESGKKTGYVSVKDILSFVDEDSEEFDEVNRKLDDEGITIIDEIPNEDLSSDSKKREAKFNKKLYVANKLRQLGAAVAMTAATIGGANAQENNSAEGLPRDVNANTIELPINKEVVEPHLSEIKYYNYYKKIKSIDNSEIIASDKILNEQSKIAPNY